MAPSAGTLTPPHSRVGHLFLSVWTVDAHFGLGLEPDAMLLTELFDVFRLGPRELSRLTPLTLGHAASCGVSCVSPAPRAAPGSARTSPAGVSGSVPSPGARLLPWKKGETRAGMRMAAGRPSGDSAGAVCVCGGGRLACVHTQTCERVRTWPSAPRAGTLELPRASPALIRHHNGRSRLLSLPLCHVPSTERRLRPPSPSLAWLSSSRASAPWWRRSGEPAPGEATWQLAHRPFASAPLAPLISQAGCSSVAGHHPLRWRCFAISSPPPSSQPICDLHTIRCSLVL